LVHAGQPLISLDHTDGKWHVAHAQSRVAEALGVMRRPAEPAAQKPEQLVARIGQSAAVHHAQFAVAGFDVHQVVETIDQRTHRRFTANPAERRGRSIF